MESIDEFLSLIFRHAPDGRFYFSNEIHKTLGKAFPKWHRTKEDYAKSLVTETGKSTDLYFSPALYLRPTRPIKSNVAGSSVVWVDCDSGLPEFDKSPSLLIETSPDHFHAYWALEGFKPAPYIEAINRQLAYKYHTDKSGWDSTQLLRPPGSYNRKRENFQAKVTEHRDSIHAFEVTAEDITTPTLQGDVSEVLARTVFTQKIRNLLFKETTSKNEGRSGLIFQTACELVSMNLPDSEIIALLMMQDDRLKKFTNHADRIGTLTGLVTNARGKVGIHAPVGKEDSRPLYSIWKGNKEFLSAKDGEGEQFIVQHLLYKQGITIIGGEPGAGKSRFTIQMLDSISCGKPFIGKAVHEPLVCAYISLDMNNRRVRDIRTKQQFFYTDVEQDLIEKNMNMFIRGYGMDLTNPELQARVQEDLIAIGAQVVCFDVLARAVPSMLDDQMAVKFLDWVQAMIEFNGISVVFVTHTRKTAVGIKASHGLDDMYGSRHWSIPPDEAFTLVNTSTNDTTMYVNKDRSGELGEFVYLYKDYNHSSFSIRNLTKKEDVSEEDATTAAGQGL